MTQESTLIICVAYAALNFKAQAQELAEALSLSLYDSSVDRSRDARDGSTYDYLLEYSDQGLVCDDAEQPAWHRSEKSSFKTSGGDTDGSGDQRSAGEG